MKRFVVLFAAFLVLLNASNVFAASVTPTVIPGSNNDGKSCAEAFAGLGLTELKFDPPNTGSLAAGTGSISIVHPSVNPPGNPNSIDFTSTGVSIWGVIVKDGVDGANKYDYSGSPVTADTYLTTPNDGDKGISHVIFCYKVNRDANVTVSKTAAGTYDKKYTWTVDKSAADETVYTAGGADGSANYTVKVSHDSGTVSNVKVTGTITVQNNESSSITLSDVTDALSDSTSCTVDKTAGLTIAATSSKDYPYSCSLSSLPAGTLTNKATATWAAQGDLNAGSKDFTSGAISFTANPIDECVSVGDDVHGLLDSSLCVGEDNPATYTYAETVKGPEGTCTSNPNTATATTNDTAATPHDNASVLDCQGADLVVTKTATPAFDKTYKWTIDKSVEDPHHVDLLPGDTKATFNYTVKVEHDSGTAGNWTVSGTITVTNPNDWQDITLTSVTDATDNGGVCTVDTSGGLVIPKGDHKDFPYSCTYASAPSPTDGTNTATANWNKTTYHTPSGSDTGTAPVTFSTATPNLIDECIDVKDSLQGTLGQVCVGDSNPKSFTYSRDVPAPATGDCVTVDNTADFKTTDTGATGSDKESVEVCSPVEDNPVNPQGSIFGPCGDPAYAGIFDNTASTVAIRFRFTWHTTKGLNKIVKMVPAGATFHTVLRWSKPGTYDWVAYQDPNTGVWIGLDNEKAVRGRYRMCNEWVPGWTFIQ